MTDCSGGGVQRFIRVAKQVDYSTEGTTFRHMGLAQDPSDTISVENVEARGVELVNAVQNSAGTRTSNVSCEFDYQIGRIFEMAFGTPTSVNTTNDYTHTFDITKVPPYYTILVGNDAQTICATKHKGHLVDSFDISYELNGNVKISVNTIGNFVEGVTTKPSLSEGGTVSPVLTFRDCGFKLNDVAVKRVQSANISVAHEVETVAGSENQDPSCVVFLGRNIEFSVNGAMNTNDFRTYVKNNTLNTVDMVIDNSVALGSGKRGFEISLGSIVVTNLEEAGAVGSITTFTLSGTGIITDLKAIDGVSTF